MAPCQALYHNYALTLASDSTITEPRSMRYDLHIVLYGFQLLFTCLACIFFSTNRYISETQDGGSVCNSVGRMALHILYAKGV